MHLYRRAADFWKRRPRFAAAIAFVSWLLICLGLYQIYVGESLVVYRGGLFYISMRQDAPWLSRSVRLALRTPTPQAEPGELTWRRLTPGLEIGEQAVLVDGEEVDRLYLTRIDPALYRFEIHIDADNDLNAWMRDLRPAAVINASYYDDQFGPATPIRADGKASGPSVYDGRHGAFVSSAARTRIVDLAHADWRDAFADAETAMVSYPLLLDSNGDTRAPESRWLASRNFVAEDVDGHILIGSAPAGFFSLYRLAEFLRGGPLRLRYVLNLDGGPVACHGVSAGGISRLIYGYVELQSDGENEPLRVLPGSKDIHALMPIVLAVFPREGAANE